VLASFIGWPLGKGFNMGYQPFYISNFDENGGLNNFYESFLTPEKAFQTLEDAMCWRGKVMKRPCITKIGRLRRDLGTQTFDNQATGGSYIVADIFSDPNIDLRATIPALGLPEPYAEIQPTTVVITVSGRIFTDPMGNGVLTEAGGSSGTINYVTGALSLTFAPPFGGLHNVTVQFFYFPGLPVMSLNRREADNINDEQNIAFDTKYAYTTLMGQFIELPSGTKFTWNGADWQLFWTTNFYTKTIGLARDKFFWATNYNAENIAPSIRDHINYYDGSDWFLLEPHVNPTTFLEQCKILIGYKSRLIAMNLWEGPDIYNVFHYPNKIRWSVNGDPTDINAWREDIPGQGSYLYAPTNEAIISVAFIRDILVVKFERSSWRLSYTGNENLPFVFQKIDTDLGSESPFSLITFGKGLLSVADKGITVDDGMSVNRIDTNIPQQVFKIKNNANGTDRVYGIRDFVSELAYFSFPSFNTVKFPDRVLVYNYNNATWAIFKDSFTCYGNYQRDSDETWAAFTDERYDTWAALYQTWNEGATSALVPNIAAGNQAGFVSALTPAIAPATVNSPTLFINALDVASIPCRITVPNHNLETGTFIKISGVLGISPLNPSILNNIPFPGMNLIYRVTVIDQNTLSLEVWDTVALVFDGLDISAYVGDYIGGGVITVLNRFDIITKEFSPFYETSGQCRLGSVDFFTSTTPTGEFIAEIYINSNLSISMTDQPSVLGTNIVFTKPENNALIPYQQFQEKIWHRMYIHAIAQNFTLEMTMSDEQMGRPDLDMSTEIFTLHALAFYLSKNARLVQ
jgi:hypothetical protein